MKKSKHKKSATTLRIDPDVPEEALVASEQPVADEIGTCHASPYISLSLRP